MCFLQPTEVQSKFCLPPEHHTAQKGYGLKFLNFFDWLVEDFEVAIRRMVSNAFKQYKD